MDVVTSGMWRYPQARAREVKGVWWVQLAGSPELVIPRGPIHDDDDSGRPHRLKQTLHEGLTSLAQLGHGDEASAARQLEQHCQNFGAPEICGSHGLPVWHDHPSRVLDRHAVTRPRQNVRPSCPIGAFPDSADPGIRVRDVVAFAKFLNALTELASHVSDRRQPAPAWMGEEILNYGLLSETQTRHLATPPGERVGVTAARRLWSMAFDAATTATGLRTTTRWRPARRPELVLEARTTAALHLADLMAHVGLNQPDRSEVCSVCGMPVTLQRAPRAGDRIYCRSDECQKIRNRQKQQRFRAKERANGKHREKA